MPSLLPTIVLVPLLAAMACLVLGPRLEQRTGWLMTAAALLAFSLAAVLYVTGGGEPRVWEMEWLPQLDIALRLRGDGFGLFFALVVSGIGALISLYSAGYGFRLPGNRLGRYYAALSAFMASMLGIALADDLMLLFVFWEITSLTSFLLIGFWYEIEPARRGALTALQVTALGGLLMMVGFVLIGSVAGTYDISVLANDPAARAALAASPWSTPALLLVLAGIFTKSAQIPFHFWLPAAMVAPTPVSTYLHAAAMVKAGVFLAGRMLPIFGDHPYWSAILVPVGLATFALGAVQALRETDLKAMLARTTFSTLGLILLVYGLQAADQDAVQILSHALYKGSLFLVVGIVEHATHTRDLRELGGLREPLPMTYRITLVAAASMAGLPPAFGFLAKEALYAELLHNPWLGDGMVRWFAIALAVLANAALFAVAAKLVLDVFHGPRRDDKTGKEDDEAHEKIAMWRPAAILAGAALLLGIAGATPLTQWLLQSFSSNPQGHLHVSLWPTHLAPLSLSLLTYALGCLVFQQRHRLLPTSEAGVRRSWAHAAWDGFIDGTNALATWFARTWQTGSLRLAYSVTLGFFALLFLYALQVGHVSLAQVPIDFGNLTWFGFIINGLIAVAAILVVRAETRLGAAVATTAVGFLVALMFVVYRSPDIVLTQILIETVSTIFILLVLYFMPVFRPDGLSSGRKLWHLGLSALTGLVMFLLVLLSTSPGFRETNNLAATYLEKSLSGGGGNNAVNVIIVDLRAMDTTGEITVLVVVGLCIYGVLRARRVHA